MSGQQSPVASERSKSEASSSDAKAYALEDGDRLWKDIRKQAGFNSYQDYVAAYMNRESRFDLRQLRDWLEDETLHPGENICSIIDVLAQEGSPPELSERYFTVPTLEVLQVLREPRKHVCIKVVFWSIRQGISDTYLNIFGLGLRIDPQFFLALIEMLRGPQQSDSLTDAVETRPLRPSHVVIDRTVATFVRHYPFDEPAAVPIILIAGEIDLRGVVNSGQLWDFTCVADQRIKSSPPFTSPSRHVEVAVPVLPPQLNLKWLHIYRETFSALAGNNRGITSCTVAIIAGALMPLLQMNCFKIRAQFLRLRRKFLALQAAMNRDSVNHQVVNHTSSKLHHERFWLRRSVEDSDDGMSHFERYISAEDANYLPESSAYLKIKQETEQIHDEARRLDAEVRDYLQLVVGNLSLEESRKSIELSNHQIQEGKRVKIFTILAFVYVPLNLATSIFGMNLQQLNQSGQNIWVFIVTGVLALLITGWSWLCVEVVTSYKGLPKKGSTDDSRHNEGLAFRLALLVWLVKKGHTTWMWRSGAWLCIPSNDKLGKFRVEARPDLTEAVARRRPEKACYYVYRGIPSKTPWRHFDLDAVTR